MTPNDHGSLRGALAAVSSMVGEPDSRMCQGLLRPIPHQAEVGAIVCAPNAAVASPTNSPNQDW